MRTSGSMVAVSGLDLFINRLRDLGHNLDNEVYAIAEEAADIIIDYAQALMDVELGRGKWYYAHDEESGAPAQECFEKQVVFRTSDSIRIKVSNFSKHYIYLEFGTRAHEILPKADNGRLRIEHPDEGEYFFTKYVEEVSGVPEFEFIQRAIRDTRETVQAMFRDSFDAYVRGSGKRTAVIRRARRRSKMEPVDIHE